MKISVLTPTIRPEGLVPVRESLMRQTMRNDVEWLVEIGIGGHDLNAAYNRMIRRAKGELIVSLQDWTRILDDGLERFWGAWNRTPRTFFTAPHGKVDDWTQKEARWDWRAGTAECTWQTCEFDWACFPRQAMFDIGGFDEEFDKHWSADNLSVCFRAEQFGYKFSNLIMNPARGIDHDRKEPHPFRDKYNPEHTNAKLEEYRFAPKLGYL